MAVEVTAVALDKSSIRLQVRNIGTPNVVNKSGTIEGCANVDVISFQINGFDVDQPRDQAEKKIGYALQTPETYLAALGIPWNATSSSENEPPVSLSRPGVKAGKALLIVNPYYPEASRKGHSGGKVIVNCVIGTDGIVHNAIIEKGATKELNELALDVLTFYRFQPAYDGDHAVAVKVPFEFSFQPY